MASLLIAPDQPLKPHCHSHDILLMTLEPVTNSLSILFSNLCTSSMAKKISRIFSTRNFEEFCNVPSVLPPWFKDEKREPCGSLSVDYIIVYRYKIMYVIQFSLCVILDFHFHLDPRDRYHLYLILLRAYLLSEVRNLFYQVLR